MCPMAPTPMLRPHAMSYEASILLAGGVDLQLLGLGHNGHIGFNEPARRIPEGNPLRRPYGIHH